MERTPLPRNMTEPLNAIYVIGAGGHGKVAIRAAQSAGLMVVGVFDDDPRNAGRVICGATVAGDLRLLAEHLPRPTFVAIGDNARRLAIVDQLQLPWCTLIHRTASVDEHANIGAGALVLAGAVVQVDATIGDHVIVNDNSTVEHDCLVGAGAHVSCNACLLGGASVGGGALIGAGAIVLPGVHVGRFAVIGAGAVVTRDVPDRAVAIGVPARVVVNALTQFSASCTNHANRTL